MEQEAAGKSPSKSHVNNTREEVPEKHQGTDQNQDISQATDAAEENNQDNTKGTANTEEVDHGKGAKESPWLKDKDNDAQEGNARDTNQGNQRDDNLGQDNPKGSPWLKDQSKGKSEEGPNAGDESRDQNKDYTQNENPQKDGEKVKDGESSNDGWKNDGPEEDIRR